MKRTALSLLSLAIVLAVADAVNKSPIVHVAARARHAGVASGTIATVLAAAVAPALPRRNPTDDATAATRRRIQAGQAGTYIGEILRERDSSLSRWADRQGAPLTIWVQPETRDFGVDARYVAGVRDAFEAWGRLHLPLHFAFVADSADAEVHVSWIDRFKQPISGRTRWSRDDDWVITDADITLALHHQDGETLDYEAVHAMALHEIGHLLGLDHTRDTTSIMTPRVRVRALSEADRATARLLYALPTGPLR